MSAAPTILLVIDDPQFRGGLMTALRARGMRPIMMGDGEQARSFLAMETPALIVVDPRIPGGGGVAWIRARREEGLAVPMVMCATSREEAQALLLQTEAYGVSSVIPKQAPADTLAAHIEELLAEQPVVEPVPDDTGRPVADLVEKLRVSLVNLQKNAESIDRLNTSLKLAQSLEKMTTALETRSDVCAAAAKKIIEMFLDARDGRSRLDNSAWVVIDKLMVRSREAAGAIAGPPPQARRTSASAHSTAIPQPEPVRSVTVDIDELSGLFTREAFLREATEKEHGAMLDGRPVAFCVIGIDAADVLRAARTLDAVVEETGRFLQARFRPDDVRGRWLPDAFAIAFPGTPGATAIATMTRTFEAFATLGLAGPNGQPVKLSAGIATYPKEGRDAALSLQTAEQRMRAAQRRGGAVVG